MQLALICAYCGKIHTSDNIDGKEAVLVVDFKEKKITFICQNTGCRKNNVFSFDNWQDKSKSSPLPRIRIT
jgi:hypothetical protein